MYEEFYQLKEKPFNLTPDPDFLFLNRDFRDALDQVIYGIERREGFTVIVGDVGTGKTTLCRTLLQKLGGSVHTALILNPLLAEEDLLKAILQDLGVKPRRPVPVLAHTAEVDEGANFLDSRWMNKLTKKELIDELNVFLAEKAKGNVFTVVVIDEAQNLSLQALEQLRILSNLEMGKQKLLQIIFVGQMEFVDKLKRPELRQLNQRISVRIILRTLSRADTAEYIKHRLKIAGDPGRLRFSRKALKVIYGYARGYPRMINLACDRTLLAGYTERAVVMTGKMARKGITSLEKLPGPANRPSQTGFRPLLYACSALVLVGTLLVLLNRWNSQWYLFGGATVSAPAPVTKESAAVTPDLKSEPPPVAAIPTSPNPKLDIASVREEPAGIELPAPKTELPKSDLDLSNVTSSQNAPSPEQYVLQLHSFRGRKQAELALAELVQGGYTAFIQQYEGRDNTDGWVGVYVGPYNSLEEAKESAQAFEGKNLIALIRKRSPKIN